MKKGKIVLIVIWILLLVGIYEYSKTTKQPEKTVEPPVIEYETLDKYEYIDYTGYYDENDLKVENIKFNEGEYNTYLKVSGLKNKTLEKEINNELYDLANNFLTEGFQSVYSYLNFNAFNVLSIRISGYNDPNIKTIYKNIDLTTGNEIKMLDILNTKDIKRIIAPLYYDAGAYTIQAEKRYIEEDIERYNYCIENGYDDCETILNSKTLEELNEEILKCDRYMTELEDDTLKFTRDFDFNQDFYITPAGIILGNINFKDIRNRENIRILIDKNPRLFNFYYKYKTDESIFDGSYTGRKNLMYAEYNTYSTEYAPSTEILDYALIHKDFYGDDEKIISESESYTNYIKSLDKNKFYYLDSFNTYDNIIQFRQCTLTKELYNNEYKKYLADEMIKPHHSQGYYDIESENVKCENLKLYINNPNVYSQNNKIYIRNNSEKTSEINSYIDTKIEELNNLGAAGLSNISVTESKITVIIYYYKNNYAYREEIIKTFDL